MLLEHLARSTQQVLVGEVFGCCSQMNRWGFAFPRFPEKLGSEGMGGSKEEVSR
jgi:hypothetical protein